MLMNNAKYLKIITDIKLPFPAAKGYSIRNLNYMAYPDFHFVHTVSARISWSHNTALLDKVKDNGQLVWYIQKAIEADLTLSTLEYQVESGYMNAKQ
ncbi:hypothetical protein FACS1894151_02210 [Spirochaetia bacterium]|nr:hypothetical protein FACS1894151_02210 [Spirochaetia bacterium]